MGKGPGKLRPDGRGSVFPPEEWPILRAALTAAAGNSPSFLADLYHHHPEKVTRVLTRHALCTWAIHAMAAAESHKEKAEEGLSRAAQRELGACAQRKWAMMQLEKRAEETGCTPIIIKGAANALSYYPKESVRPSGDIDLILPGEEALRCFPNLSANPAAEGHGTAYHFPMWRFEGYPLEVHTGFLPPPLWGRYEDLIDESLPLAGYPHLRRPSTAAAFTITLLHFIRHGGTFIFDLLDLRHLLAADDFSMEAAEALWEKEGLTEQVIPGLAVLENLGAVRPQGLLPRLKRKLPIHTRVLLPIGLRLLGTHRFSKIRIDWFKSRMNSPSFIGRMARRFVGTKATTEALCGYSPKQARFWLYHIFLLPTKRALQFWR